MTVSPAPHAPTHPRHMSMTSWHPTVQLGETGYCKEATLEASHSISAWLHACPQGMVPTAHDIITVRNGLLQSGDLRAPRDFAQQICSQAGITVEAGRNLMSQLQVAPTPCSHHSSCSFLLLQLLVAVCAQLLFSSAWHPMVRDKYLCKILQHPIGRNAMMAKQNTLRMLASLRVQSSPEQHMVGAILHALLLSHHAASCCC